MPPFEIILTVIVWVGVVGLLIYNVRSAHQRGHDQGRGAHPPS